MHGSQETTLHSIKFLEYSVNLSERTRAMQIVLIYVCAHDVPPHCNVLVCIVEKQIEARADINRFATIRARSCMNWPRGVNSFDTHSTPLITLSKHSIYFQDSSIAG